MRIVVIGNGAAGEAACSAIRSKNKKAKVTLFSEEMLSFYSPCVLTHYISNQINRSQVFLTSPDSYQKNGITAILGRRIEICDPSEKLVSGIDYQVSYDKLILATGSIPVIPKINGVDKSGVFFLKSLKDADLIRDAPGEKAIIVGSGPIGIELAVALKKRNWKVCLIEALDWILPNHLDKRGSSIVTSLLEKMGIDIRTTQRVLAIEGKKKVENVVTTREGIKADMVVLTTGMRPNVELARSSGIHIGELGGIVINDRMETNLNDVYACGDCVEGRDPFDGNAKLSLLWPQAQRQGRVAGLNSLGEIRKVRWITEFINMDIFGTFIGSMGRTQGTSGQGAEIRESESNGCYRCVVIIEGRVAGAQFIGDHEAMGVFLPFMGKDSKDICNKLSRAAKFSLYPFAADLLS